MENAVKTKEAGLVKQQYVLKGKQESLDDEEDFTDISGRAKNLQIDKIYKLKLLHVYHVKDKVSITRLSILEEGSVQSSFVSKKEKKRKEK